MSDKFYNDGEEEASSDVKDPFMFEDEQDDVNSRRTQRHAFDNNISSFEQGNYRPNVSSPKPNDTSNSKFTVNIKDFDSFSQPIQQSANRTQTQNSGANQRNAARRVASQQRQTQSRRNTAQRGNFNQNAATKNDRTIILGNLGNNVNTQRQRPQQNPSTEASRKEARLAAVKAAKRRKTFVSVFACLALVVLVTTILSSVAVATINDILVLDKNVEYSVAVNVPQDADFDDVFELLADNGLVKQKFVSKLFCEFRHYDTVEYEAGVYYLDVSLGIEKMLETIKVSSLNSKDTITLTFPEGYTVAQIFAKLERYEVCDAEKLYANLDIIASQYDFYKAIDPKYGRYLKAEGYLFPDTYDFFIGESPSSVMKKLFDNFEKKWKKEYDEQLAKLGMTKDEIISIAAMIQREAKDTSQMGDISSVIHNRLDDPQTYPNLQMNSTSDYVTGMRDLNLFTEFYYDIYVETYNTYKQVGLPAGPICSPGSSAIYYALFPNDTDYLYFCHDKLGTIYMAETADEHYVNTQKII